MRVPASAFGPGSQRPFAEYFEGESRVPVGSIDGIVAWLQTCEYVTDLELFHQPDVWLHPGAFERLRRGDCEDFALWAWRKLAEIGIDAEFCVGRVICDDRPEIDRIQLFHDQFGTTAEEMETAAAAQIAGLYQIPFLGIRVLSNNITNDGKYDGGTGEACQEYIYDVIKGYIATLKR